MPTNSSEPCRSRKRNSKRKYGKLRLNGFGQWTVVCLRSGELLNGRRARCSDLVRRFQTRRNMSTANASEQKELPRYKSHKEVHALKIAGIKKNNEDVPNSETDGSAIITPADERYAPFRVEHEYMSKHKP